MLLQSAASCFRRQAASRATSVASTCRLGDAFLAPTTTHCHQQRFASDTIYKFGVAQEHLDTVKATLPLVAKAGTDFTKHFYGRMFAGNPELLNIFNQTNQTLGGQPKKLLKTVAVAAQAAVELGELPGEAIEGICQKHAALHVTPEAYNIVGANLLGTIEDLLTKDKAVLDAWGALYGDIANVFITRESEIAQQVTSVPGSWAGRRKFVLVEKETISSVVRRFKFKPVDGQSTPNFEPGKYTTIWVPVDDEGPYGHYREQPRHYTLNLPREGENANESMSISVKKQGLVSRILHAAEVGTEWELSAPHGCFDMTGVEKLWLSAQDAPVVFISAGVGITPGNVTNLSNADASWSCTTCSSST
jgi:nitric oxide dioxygenase